MATSLIDAEEVYALLMKKLKGVVSGIQSITTKPDGTGIVFHLNNGSTITLNIPDHVHTNLNTVLEKLTVDTNGNLLFDGIKLITEEEFIIVNKYSDLVTPTKDCIAYVLVDETISSVLYKKGFYVFYNSKWESIGSSDFELNSWKPNNSYQKDEYAYINYKLYKSLKIHTSTIDFDNDLTSGNWELIIGGGAEEINPWKSGKTYVVSDKVTENGDIYQCIKPHTSNIFADEIDSWMRINKEYAYCTIDQYKYLIANGLIENKLYVVDGIDGTETIIKEWKENTIYGLFEKVSYQSDIYECIIPHTSTILFDDNKDNWVKVIDEKIIYCVKDHYDYMKANSLLKEKIYIVDRI